MKICGELYSRLERSGSLVCLLFGGIIIRYEIQEIVSQRLEFAKTSGIYLCYCTANDKVYVGQTVNLYIRKVKNHCPDLRHNHHCNPVLQNTWNKYGEDCFIWAVIEYCETDKLLERELFWINKLNALHPHGFNLVPTNGCGTLGLKMSKQSKEKLKETWTKTRKAEQGRRSKQMWDDMTNEEYNSMCQKMKDAYTDERKQIIGNNTKQRWFNYSDQEKMIIKNKISNNHSDVSGKNNPKAKSVINIDTGEIFDTVKEAAQFYKINYSTLKARLQGQRKIPIGSVRLAYYIT